MLHPSRGLHIASKDGRWQVSVGTAAVAGGCLGGRPYGLTTPLATLLDSVVRRRVYTPQSPPEARLRQECGRSLTSPVRTISSARSRSLRLVF